MSYPGPPGVSSPHPSLPPRPPSASTVKKPAGASQGPPSSRLPSLPTAYGTTAPPGYPAATVAAPYSYPTTTAPLGYNSPAITAPPAHYGASPTFYSQPPSAAPVKSAGAFGRDGHSGGGSSGNNRRGGGHNGAYSAYNNTFSPTAPAYPNQAPQIRNPFPAPGVSTAAVTTPHSAAGDDAEMAAQIAQWQSAYIPKNEADHMAAAGGYPYAGADAQQAQPQYPQYPQAASAGVGAESGQSTEETAGQASGHKKTVYRAGGGKKWTDDTLMEWDPSHLRIFVGNLAGETTDESLLKAFSRWKSVAKAKVVRDKRNNKSKGYGFVAFADPDDFFQAAKEMNGKYIQSHPVTIKKAKDDIVPKNLKEDKRNNGGKNKRHSGNRGGSGSGAGAGAGAGGAAYEPHLGPVRPGGVVKPGQKTKGGLKLLG
ncbi:hypothetical protein RB601_001116 [Gaeumannomyces tritici]